MEKLSEKVQPSRRAHRIPKFVAWFYPRRFWYGKENSIYLTFDDGPHPKITPWLLSHLKQHEVKATFFWQGENIEKYPELVERALEEGHVVGHHGYKHLAAHKISFQEFQENFEKSNQLVESGLFRPPYGKINRKQAKWVEKRNKIAMWSWISYDYDSKLTDKYIIQMAKREVREKDVVLFHENDKTTHRIKEIIPPFIQIIKEKGLNFAVMEKEDN